MNNLAFLFSLWDTFKLHIESQKLPLVILSSERDKQGICVFLSSQQMVQN